MIPAPRRFELLRRFVLLPALLLYCAVLLFAAVPDELRPAALAEAQSAVRDAFEAAWVRPYAFVFQGHRGRWKRRTVLLTAHIRLPDGALERVFAAPEAPPSGFRWFQPAEETFALLAGVVITPANRLVRSTTRKGRRRVLHTLRANRRLQRLARFACHSTHAGADRGDRVYLSVGYDAIDYETGRLFESTHVVQVYDCGRDRPVGGGRWPAATRDAEGMPLPTPGHTDPLFERRRRSKSPRVRALPRPEAKLLASPSKAGVPAKARDPVRLIRPVKPPALESQRPKRPGRHAP